MTSKKLETVEPAAPATTIEALAADKAPDPFDLANLRLAQNFNETAGVKKLLRTVPVRKPNKQDFIRVHPDAAYRENFAMVELKEDREEYLVAGAGLIAELAAEIVNKTVYTAINRQGVVFLWPVRLPDADGKQMEWHRSAHEAAGVGTKSWIRVSANMSLGAYEIIVAEAITAEPQFPEVSFQDLIRIAFRERLITSLDHPKELRSGRTFRSFQGEFGSAPPYATGADVLFVAYYASAELGCYRALGWPMPERVLDLFCEFRDRTNGLPTPSGSGELGALIYFGLDHMDAVEKKYMQEMIGSGKWRGALTPKQILDYCARDVRALEQLLLVMAPKIDLPRALLRGRSVAAASAMEWNGPPIDVPQLRELQENWVPIQDRLIAAIDSDYGVFDGRTFKRDRFAAWLVRQDIPWPLLESGQLDLEDGTFRQMAKSYPAVSPLRELRSSLSDLRLNDLAVGHDGRNRTVLSTFRARTGRNQPSNTKFIFGPSVWLRGLIKPPPGYGVAYVDWSQQEFGIAAYLSGDRNMIAAYLSGDPYLAFGKQAGLIPADGTQKTQKIQRELCKQCVLAVQYGMGEWSLAARIGQPPIVARDLLRAHRETYSVFWRWSDAVLDTAMSTNSLHTTYGWHIHIGEDPNPRSLRNFPMQANGAEMLRIAACLATERGIEVCAPVHDAFLIAAPLDRLDADIARMRQAMAEASRAVLGGFEIRTDCPDEFDDSGKPNEFPHVIRYPRRYMDERGAVMWQRVLDLLPRQRSRAATA